MQNPDEHRTKLRQRGEFRNSAKKKLVILNSLYIEHYFRIQVLEGGQSKPFYHWHCEIVGKRRKIYSQGLDELEINQNRRQ